MRRVLAIGALLIALSGCGTVQNFRREPATEATVYGGVEIAAGRFNEDPIAVALLWPFWAADVVLSAAGDTLTLPFAISLAITKGINDYYFPPKVPGDSNSAPQP